MDIFVHFKFINKFLFGVDPKQWIENAKKSYNDD